SIFPQALDASCRSGCFGYRVYCARCLRRHGGGHAGHCRSGQEGRNVVCQNGRADQARQQGRMNIAVVGCGYVADLYGKTLWNYPDLRLVGAYDRNAENLQKFCHRWPGRQYSSLAELLEDRSIELVLNLTNPRSHYDVTRKCIEARKHVYTE